MRKLYILLLSSSSVLGFSQTILNQQENTTRTVADPNVVVLAPGFRAVSSQSDPFVAKIGPATENPGGGPETPSTAGSTNPSGTTDTEGNRFHDTQGNIDVNGGGQLQFTLPIALPPGVKSVAPQINLVYTSGAGNGIAGYGWNLSGITSISRVGRTIEKDGEVRGIQLDYSDYYSFNGQRLILKAGEYGKDGAEYVTEKFSNVKVKSLGTNQWNTGPAYWEVTFEDGSQAWYGAVNAGTSTAITPMEYNIVKWEDAQTNYITYEYLQDLLTNVARISIIKWGGNAGKVIAHFNEIIFTYNFEINRNFREEAYHESVKFIQKDILTSIQVNTNNSLFKKYNIEYDNSKSSYELVKKITEINASNQEANPVKISYVTPPSNSEELSFEYPITSYSTKKYGDYNMDGEVDFIEYNNGVINYKSSIYKATNPSISLQFDSTKFSGSDFKNATTVNIKKDGYMLDRMGLAIPVKKNINSSETYKNDYEIQIFSIDLPNQTLNFEYSKTITYEQFAPDGVGYYNEPNCTIFAPQIADIQPYDFNGNGITELLVKFKILVSCPIDPNPYAPTHPSDENNVSSSTTFNLVDKNNTETQQIEDGESLPHIRETFYSTILIDLEQALAAEQSIFKIDESGFDFTFADLNGDGLQDIIYKDQSKINTVFNIKRTPNYVYSRVNVGNFAGFTFSGYSSNTLYGDFNGDSKTDMLIPQGDKSYNWNLYISNGKTFNSYSINNFIYFLAGQQEVNKEIHHTAFESGCTYSSTRYFQYNIGDFDADGKSDIEVTSVWLTNHQWRAHANDEETFTSVAVYSVNKDANSSNKSKIYNPSQFVPVPLHDPKEVFSNNNIDNTNSISTNSGLNFYRVRYWEKRINDKVIPFSTLNINRDVQQLILVGKADDCEGSCNKNYVLQYTFPYYPIISRVNTIEQGGIITSFLYKELNPSVDSNFYKPIKKELFPFYELNRVPLSSVVYQANRILSPGNVLIQDYRYRGLLSHYTGKGNLGFRQTARSSWYTSNVLNNKIWTGVEIDPLKEGVPIKEWATKPGNDEAFPADISENNTQLLSFKSTEYRFDKLLNGSPVDINSVPQADKARVVSATVSVRSVTKDFMKDVRSENRIVYDKEDLGPVAERYYLPTKTKSSVNNDFAVSTTSLEYIHNVSGTGKDYYIGRPASKTEQMTVYGDTKGTKEEYAYKDHLLKTKKSWNRDNSGWFLETYGYDGFGNITEKTVTTSLNSNHSKTDRAQYDPKGRFVIKKTDHLGLETLIEYNDWGQVTKQTDPLGAVLTNTYDNWGKTLTSKTNLGGTTTYKYKKESTGDAVVTEYAPDGTEKISYTNKLGQNYLSKARKFGQGQYVSVLTAFDALGRKIAEWEPFSGSYPTQLNTIEYDEYSRTVKATSFTGKIVESVYNGRTVTTTETNANNRFKKQTADAVGNIISSEDLGGVITYKFNAAGENTEANYEGNIVKTAYDAWGNKVRFEDPSNGVYEYEYKGYFGAVSKIKSPKGEKTYEYNSLGQLIRQNEKTTAGNATDKIINFNYSSKGLITRKYGTSLGKSYSSGITYDSFGRVLSSSEDSNGKYFLKKGITYDDRMRVTSYEKQLYSAGILTKVSIENEYDTWSGALYRVKEKGTGKVLWQLNEVNDKGQVTRAKLGGANIENWYADNGFLDYTNHKSAVSGSTVLYVKYIFDAIKNELNSRTTGGDFNIIEQFQYDDNNRLYNWTDPVTGAFTRNQQRNVYDNKGRITQNDQVGTIKFDNTAKKYRASGMVLNAAGTQNYTNDLVQRISYNENNDPVFIDGMKGDVAFEYGLTSMRQRVSYGGNFDESSQGKFTKYYSEDASFEVIRDNQTGQEKHLIYIGGSPYESDIVFVKNYTESSGSFKFLHKDYLGSILAITDEAGTKLEQRHFDAWGNLTHLKIGGNATITDKEQIRNYLSEGNLIVDRGYTSHEHFAEVGLIHMNGRLYDPLLRRFLNADENIQDPHNTQNYNKYGYVMNNPLMYNDPSGEVFVLFGLTPILTAIIVGAAVGLASYVITGLITGQEISLLGAFKATVFGAVSGAVTFGIGTQFKVAMEGLQIANNVVKAAAQAGLVLAQAAAHGVAQGALSLMQGGNATMGAISGAFGSLGASVFGAGMNAVGLRDFAGSAAGTILSGAVLGGVGSELVGGNFWQGAVIGGIVAGLNHEMHQMTGPGDDELIKKLTPEQRKQLEQIKSGTQLTTEALQKTGLDKVLDNWIENTALGKNLKVGVVDYLSMGGEIYYDHKLQQYNGISKNEFTFRFVTKAASGLTSGHFGSLAGAAVGAEYGATVGGVVGTVVGAGIGFYIENTYWRGIKYFDNFMTRFGGYIQRQAIFNARRGF